MIIGIDIDDTLTYLHDTKIKLATEYIKKNNMPYKLVRTDTNLFSEMFDWGKEECDKFWFEIGNDMLNNAVPRQNASEVITKLKNAGHKIIIVTARSVEWNTNPYEMSFDWLKKNKIPFDELLVGHIDKTQICLDKKIDLFIDDMPKILTKLEDAKIKTILMDAPHNQNEKSFKVAKNWNEVLDYISNFENSKSQAI